MSEGSKIGESHKAVQEARRRRRLAAALRENLKRRKTQAKGRVEGRVEGRVAAPHDSAGIADDKSGR
ncbi:MAG TPA: hypothetical protein VG145_07790 [Xanthobacteraceae bacterium]|jgi:hypothetical protein|nr:hypothetical protein [Xanthobacteraceae bacterium]